ncbi:SusC/RagA family TonB-linked outer membrane protein [Flavobacterium sp. F-65]|uniref:SusC/RagA family TonB-linked outer membrane protein n=1 Tax=Flavobacterium pisciphilum TaxID=2893755 RepID=A0ABS8MUK5_9FLAO|nr:SusC/RagA family TonB-linked outer membrane protein [Flavobacterium sp. F-65]MCC9071792.1 SusC/RagA family TonB-linked outer membrane protein [Flavobacterium sp. F-65]
MKLNFNGSLVVLLLLIAQLTFAQERVVSGVVSDNAGMPLPGVSVLVKGTKSGTQTDFDGKYSIKASPSQILVFSYIGMKTQEIAASTSTINTKLSGDALELEGVVVTTAMGIKREKKSLGYAAQQISGKDLSGGAGNTNVANLLSGKAAGVEVSRNNNFGGSTNVVIRGSKSLTGNNQALWVIDGVPIDNSNSNATSQQVGGGGYDYGNNASDINQEDIESINILKGAAATALYGSRAANGVVMVTTKKGKTNDNKIGFTFSSGYTNGTIDKSTFPTYQNRYGSGYGFGSSFLGTGTPDTVDTSNDASDGDIFDNQLVYQWDAFTPFSPNFGKATPWTAAKNGPVTFFNNANTFVNSISLEKSTDRSSLSMSYVNTNQTGILPNSELKKNQLSARFSQKVTDKLTANAYASVTLQSTTGRNSTGYNDNIMGNFRQWWQTNTDVQAQKDVYFASGGQNVTWNWADPTDPAGLKPAYWDNPYFTRYQNYSSDDRTRLFGYASLNYEITPWLSALGRVSLDTYKQLQEERRAVGSIASGFGLSPVDEASGYQRNDINFQEVNYDLMLNFNKKIGSDISLNGVLGMNVRRNDRDNVLSSTIGGLVTPGIYALSNSRLDLPFPKEAKISSGVNGLYAQGSIGYLDTYFVDASIRRDVSSTLPSDNNSYVYPAVSGSFLFSNLVKANWLNLGKFRVNYAEVGNDADALQLNNTYTRVSNFQGQPLYTNALLTPFRSINKNPNLKPERTKSFEVGLEASLLDRRLGFDVTYYKTNSVDQIVSAAVSSASQYTNGVVNGGDIENKGFEIQLYGTPIRTKDFSWEVIINWSNNKSKVISLPNGLDNLQLGSFQSGVTINAAPGEAYGALKGTDYVYTNGQRTIDQSNGKYMITTSSANTIGNVTPDWIGGIRNKFNYKNLSFGFLIDTQKGGDIFSLDMSYGLASGLYKETAIGDMRENGVLNQGVAPDGSPNTVKTKGGSVANSVGYQAAPNKAFIYDASFVKLREVSITYNFPKSMFENTFINAASLSLLGSNLWIISKNLPYADPESGLSSGNSSRGYSVGSLPTTRDIGFNLTFKF